MHNWRLLLFACLAAFQPIASFTDRRLVDGRQCCDNQSDTLLRARTLYGPLRDGKLASEERLLIQRPESRETRRNGVTRDEGTRSVLNSRSDERRFTSRDSRISPELNTRNRVIENRRERESSTAYFQRLSRSERRGLVTRESRASISINRDERPRDVSERLSIHQRYERRVEAERNVQRVSRIPVHIRREAGRERHVRESPEERRRDQIRDNVARRHSVESLRYVQDRRVNDEMERRTSLSRERILRLDNKKERQNLNRAREDARDNRRSSSEDRRESTVVRDARPNIMRNDRSAERDENRRVTIRDRSSERRDVRNRQQYEQKNEIDSRLSRDSGAVRIERTIESRIRNERVRDVRDSRDESRRSLSRNNEREVSRRADIPSIRQSSEGRISEERRDSLRRLTNNRLESRRADRLFDSSDLRQRESRRTGYHGFRSFDMRRAEIRITRDDIQNRRTESKRQASDIRVDLRRTNDDEMRRDTRRSVSRASERRNTELRTIGRERQQESRPETYQVQSRRANAPEMRRDESRRSFDASRRTDSIRMLARNIESRLAEDQREDSRRMTARVSEIRRSIRSPTEARRIDSRRSNEDDSRLMLRSRSLTTTRRDESRRLASEARKIVDDEAPDVFSRRVRDTRADMRRVDSRMSERDETRSRILTMRRDRRTLETRRSISNSDDVNDSRRLARSRNLSGIREREHSGRITSDEVNTREVRQNRADIRRTDSRMTAKDSRTRIVMSIRRDERSIDRNIREQTVSRKVRDVVLTRENMERRTDTRFRVEAPSMIRMKSEDTAHFNWAYLLYTMQVIYLCGMIAQMMAEKPTSKKPRFSGWNAPFQRMLKVD